MRRSEQLPSALSCANFSCFLCKESACLLRELGVPISLGAVVDQTASSTASNTSVAISPAVTAAHPMDLVTVRTGTASTGTIANAPAASTSANLCQRESSCSTMLDHPKHARRRTSRQTPPRHEVSPAREPGDRLGKCRRALARLGQACGLPTFTQTDDAPASLAVYHSKQRHSGQSDAGSAVPVLSRLNRGCCPTFIVAFTPHWRKPSITGDRNDQRWVQISHPFHPLHGRRFVLLLCRQAWNQDRVYFEDDVGHVQSIPAKWTDVVAADPFVVIGAGRALFRLDDLIEIVRLIRSAEP